MMMTFAGGITGFLWSFVMILGMALPVILVIWALLAIGERATGRKTGGTAQQEILNTRLAKGEISLDDFQRIRGQIT